MCCVVTLKLSTESANEQAAATAQFNKSSFRPPQKVNSLDNLQIRCRSIASRDKSFHFIFGRLALGLKYRTTTLNGAALVANRLLSLLAGLIYGTVTRRRSKTL